ncbi:ECF transporter S component [Halobacillus sp. ACCC02827]|uniref:ECF transporter S component n=1 Tax=Halobacillus sp. ACCC02827 TaxID=3052090 RepID=UPI00256FBE29|nr:ECF transporter S component [Halobacillus sp. ACCC02827]WJE14131.1 ECF transporter S component [Halobacillus sp. ACCC02827]
MNTYKLTLIAMLSALAVAGRMALANIPNVQPVTAIIIIAGFWLGPVGGVLVAFVTTLTSNLLLGMGMWTVWQITAWGLIGVGAGILGKVFPKLPVWLLSVYGFLSGIFYGFVLSLTMHVAGQPFWAYYLAGIPMDINHAVSNTVFLIVMAPVLGRLFRRYPLTNHRLDPAGKLP